MFEPIRWITLHPALVHLPLGSLPLAALAYLVAARRGSERWSRVADVALVFAALSATVAAGLGLLAWFLVSWPGGLEPWPLVHAVLGGVAAAGALALVGWRWRRLKRQHRTVAWSEAYAAVALTGLTLFTGWVGGEVLVYHAGVGVQAGGLGALAPPVSWPREPPQDVHEAMGRLRAAWGAASSRLAAMVVDAPSEAHYAGLVEDARRMREVTQWIVAGEAEPHRHEAEAPGVGGAGRAGEGEAGHAHTGRAEIAELARLMLPQTRELEQAARQKDLVGVSESLGAITGTCAGCHLQHRWSPP